MRYCIQNTKGGTSKYKLDEIGTYYSLELESKGLKVRTEMRTGIKKGQTRM